MKRQSPDGIKRLVRDVRQKQSNILPTDFIANDRDVEDVLWHGPSRGSGIQRAGAFVMGVSLLISGLGVASFSYERHAWLGLVPTVVIAGAGIRVVYKSLRGRTARKV